LVDIIRELLESNGYNAILVIMDCLSKMIIAIPMNMDLTVYETARLFRDHVWSKHGLPKKVISNRGPQFTLNS
jgi:transposase InsO family protein